MAFSSLRTPVTSGLVALLLGASACTSVTRKDVWKPEKEFSQTLPAGQREVTEYTTEFLSERKGDSIDLRVMESAVKKTFNVYTLQSNRRERQYMEEVTKENKNAGALTGWSLLTMGGLTSLFLGFYLPSKEKENYMHRKEKYPEMYADDPADADGIGDEEEALYISMALGGLGLSILGFVGVVNNSTPQNFNSYTKETPTDILRVSPAGTKEVTEQQGEPQVLYKQTPRAGIEVIATSDFFTLNGAQQRASFLTDQQGNAKLAVQLPSNYTLREKALYNALMPKVEEGSMQLDDVKGYVQQHAEQRTITLKTALPVKEGVNVRKNAEQTITYTVYELPK